MDYPAGLSATVEADLVRLVQLDASERFNVMLGPEVDCITIGETLSERDAQSLAAHLRRIVDSCIDQALLNMHRRRDAEVEVARATADAAEAKADEASEVAAAEAKGQAIRAVDKYITDRKAAGRGFAKCCYQTANGVKAAVREVFSDDGSR